MFDALSRMLVEVLRLPPEPPSPFGEEQSLKVFRAAPQYYKYQLILWGIGHALLIWGVLAGVIFLIVGAFNVHSTLGSVLMLTGSLVVLAVYAAICLISFLSVRLHYEMRWYKVTDRSLRIREGVFFVREMTMTFLNIQNIEISQGPIQRWLGIADIQVHTAGGGGAIAQAQQGNKQQIFNMHVGYFRGVDNAQEIVTMMQERLRKCRSAGLGDHEDHHIENAHEHGSSRSSEVLDAARGLLDEIREFRATAQAASVH